MQEKSANMPPAQDDDLQKIFLMEKLIKMQEDGLFTQSEIDDQIMTLFATVSLSFSSPDLNSS